MERCYIGSGGDVGHQLQLQEDAFRSMESRIGPIVGRSSFYRTAPWGVQRSEPFTNAVVAVETELGPFVVLRVLQEIELDFGRKRTFEQYGPRTLDLDLLFYGDQIIDTVDLKVPHPRFAQRRFVLAPMAELAPSFCDPVYGEDMLTLLAKCADPGTVQKLECATIT